SPSSLGEEQRGQRVQVDREPASMGSPSSLGEEETREMTSRCSAGPSLQWGRRVHSAKSRTTTTCPIELAVSFNGVAEFTRRRARGRLPPGKVETPRFNGVAEFTRRRAATTYEEYDDCLASMGSPSSLGEELISKSTQSATFDGFNGVAEFTRRRAGAPS